MTQSFESVEGHANCILQNILTKHGKYNDRTEQHIPVFYISLWLLNKCVPNYVHM